MSEIKILDACCGGKMFWFNKHESHTTYLDNQIPFNKVLKIIPASPILGDKRGHTRWYVIIRNQADGLIDTLPFW